MRKKQGNPNNDSRAGRGTGPGDTPRAAHPTPTSLTPRTVWETHPSSTAAEAQLGGNRRVCFHAARAGFCGEKGCEAQRAAGRASSPGCHGARAQPCPQGSPGAQSPRARVLGMQPPARAALQPTQPDDGEHKTTVIALITSAAERRGQAGEPVRRRRKDLRGKELALPAAPSLRR